MNSSPLPSHHPRSVARTRASRFRYSPVGFLGALALLFLAMPAVEDLQHGDVVVAILLTLVLISAVLAVGARRRTLLLAALLVVPALAGKWLDYFWPELVPAPLFLGAGMVFVLFIAWHLLQFILRAPHVDAGVICAGISAYLMLGFLWALAYALVAHLSPGAFAFTVGPETGRVMKGFNAFYFSFVTLSTVGYGDIIPISKAARMLAVTESVTGLFFVTILISRLVALYSSSRPSARQADPAE